MSRPASEIQCPVCGYYCLGKGGFGCIDKPTLVKIEDERQKQDHEPAVNKQAEELDEQITNFLWDFFEASVEQAVNQLSHGRKSKESVIANTRPKLISIFQAEKERAVRAARIDEVRLVPPVKSKYELDNYKIDRLAELQKGDSDARS